jgi:ABC-type transport system involved in multi-copper enzyme maturation permease subunit
MSTQLPKEYELPLEAYKLLTNLLQHDEVLSWRRIEIFLVFNGGLIAILGLVWRSQNVASQTPRFLPIMICAIGVVMCFLWVIIVRRSEAFYNHWYEQLKFLEKEYLSPINTFQIADEYFAKGRIKLGQEEFKLDFVSRRMHIYHILMAVPLVLLTAWLSLGIYVIYYTQKC